MVARIFVNGRDYRDEKGNFVDRNLISPRYSIYLQSPKEYGNSKSLKALGKKLAGKHCFVSKLENSIEIYVPRIK